MSGGRQEDEALQVYYDGACPLCSAEVAHYSSRIDDGRVHFIDVSDLSAVPGHDLSREDALARFHLRRRDGALTSGADAFVELWETMRGWRWAAKVSRLPGVTPLLEGLYRAFLPVRPALSRSFGRVQKTRARLIG